MLSRSKVLVRRIVIPSWMIKVLSDFSAKRNLHQPPSAGWIMVVNRDEPWWTIECRRMSCMHCRDLHGVCIAVTYLMSLAWRPASLSVRAFATSVFLLYGCCPGKQWPTATGQGNPRTIWTCFFGKTSRFITLHHLHHAQTFCTKTTKWHKQAPLHHDLHRGERASLQRQKHNQTEALRSLMLPWQSRQLTANHAVQVLLQQSVQEMLKGSKGSTEAFFPFFSAILFNVANPVFGKLSEGIAQPPLLSDLQRNQRTRSTGAVDFKLSFESFESFDVVCNLQVSAWGCLSLCLWAHVAFADFENAKSSQTKEALEAL